MYSILNTKISHIAHRISHIFLLLFVTINLAAQGDKLMTMEDVVFGNLRPQSYTSQWQSKKNVLTYLTKGNNLIAETADKGKKTTLISLEEFNKIIGAELKSFPAFYWMNNTSVAIRVGQVYYQVNIEERKIDHKLEFPEGAQNIEYNGKDAFAYTIDNNLYYITLNSEIHSVTNQTDKNIVSGQSVSRNEFGINGGIFWSPDGKKLAFYQKDETAVTTFPLLDITTRTGSLVEIKYPMAGMSSEKVKLGIYDLETKQTVFLDVKDFDEERYLTNIAWAPASDHIYVQVLNRPQKHMRLNRYNVQNGTFVKTVLEETNSKYVEPQKSIIFLNNNPAKFIYCTNDRHGYKNLYLCDTTGNEIKRLTEVNADVAFVGEDGNNIYYTSAEVSPVENHLFSVNIKTGKKTQLTSGEGWHNIYMSADKKYFTDKYTSVYNPGIAVLMQNNGKQVRELYKSETPGKDYKLGEVTLGTVKSADGAYDNYYRMIKPVDFDPAKKYPVIVYVYGGPHSQMVRNSWQASIRYWEMYMAQRGYVVFVMDNRGTSNRGQAFEQVIHKQCGQAEMADQMKGVDFLKSHAWVDASRIGVHGWSYGGFMTISLITNYPDVFKVGVAGGPVIDWKWYEIMYGERYMETPQSNPEGYEKTSLINKAKDLKGKLLICQGAIDPVVVWEHSLSFVRECVKNNIQLDYFPYPCAEHNVMGKDRVHLMQKVTDYFEDYL